MLPSLRYIAVSLCGTAGASRSSHPSFGSRLSVRNICPCACPCYPLTFPYAVFAVGLLYGSGRPNGDYFAGFAAMSVTAYTASTFAFNVVVTGLICGRLAYMQHYMQSYYGADRRLYAGAVAIVVESALPFTLFNLAYLVAFAVGTDVAFAFSFYAMFTVSLIPLSLLRSLRFGTCADCVRLSWMALTGCRWNHCAVYLPASNHPARPVPESVDADFEDPASRVDGNDHLRWAHSH